jgi:hypothetical protein
MSTIILEGHSYYNANLTKKDIYSIDYKDVQHARILIDVKSELCCTQMQFVSYESKKTYWTKDELLIAFNEAYLGIKRFVETDGPLGLFIENIFHPESNLLKKEEIKDNLQIEILKNKKNFNKLSTELLRVKTAASNFDKCKNKLFEIINWGPDFFKLNHYNINRVIDYLSNVANAGVVTVSNNENLSHIRSAFDELRGRKITNNSTYKTIHDIAQRDIYTLEFPRFFKTDLPQNEINQVLDEIC